MLINSTTIWKERKHPHHVPKTSKRYRRNTINSNLCCLKTKFSGFDEEISLIKEKFKKAIYSLFLLTVKLVSLRRAKNVERKIYNSAKIVWNYEIFHNHWIPTVNSIKLNRNIYWRNFTNPLTMFSEL